jgi:hypothetical protein
MARKYPAKDVKILYGSSGGQCAKCLKDIIKEANENDNSAQIGKISHIVGHKPDGPRGDPNYPKEKLDVYENWILLCGSCHDEIDVQPNSYSIEDIRKMKNTHEKRVKRRREKDMLNFESASLEIAIRNIKSGKYSSIDISDDLDTLYLEDKIKKNNLNENTRGLISSGIFRSKEVGKFFYEMSMLDNSFLDEVKMNFQIKYLELKNQGLDGDSIFFDLLEFARGGTTDSLEEAASLAILCHLFEICEVFEK